MDVVIRLGVRIEMHWPLFSIGTLQLNSSPRQLKNTSLRHNIEYNLNLEAIHRKRTD